MTEDTIFLAKKIEQLTAQLESTTSELAAARTWMAQRAVAISNDPIFGKLHNDNDHMNRQLDAIAAYVANVPRPIIRQPSDRTLRLVLDHIKDILDR